MAFIILGLYRNMGNVPSAAADAARSAARSVREQRLNPPGSHSWQQKWAAPPPRTGPPAKQENTKNIIGKKAYELQSFHTMNPGLQSTINELIQRDGGTSKNFVLLEFRNGINSNNILLNQLKEFNKLILDPTHNEVAAQREEKLKKSRSINRVRIWTGAENKQFPALALQRVSDGYPGLFRHFFRDNGTDPKSLLMVASASDKYNFWKYKNSKNIQKNDKENFDTIVLLCIISPDNDVTYDLDRSALDARDSGDGNSLYKGLLNAADDNIFRMLAYKTKAEYKELGDSSVNVRTGLSPSEEVALAYRNAVAELAPRGVHVDDSEKDPRAKAAAAVKVFLAVVTCAVDALTRWSGNPPSSNQTAVTAIKEFSSLGGKLETNLETEGSAKDVYISSVLNILIELTGGRGNFDERNRTIQVRILNRFHVPYMNTIANTATPMLLSLLKTIKSVNEVELLIVLRNLTSASHINIIEQKLRDTINILLEKVKAPDNGRLVFVLGILYNMTYMPDGNEAVKNGMLSEAAAAASEAGEAVKKGVLSAAGGAIMNIANSTEESQSQLKNLAQRILKNTGLATTGGSRRIKKRKIESTRRRHKKHGR